MVPDNGMDSEIKAMADISAALSALEPEAVRRILRWATSRFGTDSPVGSGLGRDGTAGVGTQSDEVSHPVPSFENLPELFDTASPATGLDKVLVAAYWFQVIQGEESLDSFQINKELKNLGHPSTNITRDLSSLMNRTPRFVLQTRKEGTTKQARKRYRLTREGVRAVEDMLRAGRAS